MFGSFKFPTLRLRGPKGGETKEDANPRPGGTPKPVRSKPPKTPVLGANRVKRHQRRRSEPGLLPTIAGFKKESSVQDADRFAPGDRICSINGIATARLTNEEVIALLDNVEERASLEVEYYLPNYDSQSSLCITSRVAQVSVEREGGSLGITLRALGSGGGCNGGGGAARPGGLLVTHVRPNGPAHRTHRIKAGDRLLKVDNVSLANKSLAEAYQILQTCPPITNLTIEYDISIMESVKFATGPLLIEIERGCNENLGLLLTDKGFNEECFGAGANYQSGEGSPGIYIESIVPASISDRCGALHPGDQLLAVDDLAVDSATYTPEEIMCYMENCSGKGFTQLQILPVHMLLKNYRMGKTRGMQPGSPVSGMSTLNSRKSHRQNRQLRQSSVPKTFEMDPDFLHNNFVTGVGVCRSEILSIQLEIPPNQDSGVTVCEDRELLLISHITHQSPAYRSGCLQLGDRIISINSQQNLTANAANDVLQKRNDTNCTRYLNIKAEFSMADSVEASSGVFNVKLAKNGAGLGVTITGNKQRGQSKEEPMIISNIKVGSVAYRSGTLAVGDQLIAIDSQPLNNISLEAAFSILQNFPDDIITLTVRKTDTRNDWRDLHNNSIKSPNFNYSMLDSPSSVNSSVKSGCLYARVVKNNQAANEPGEHVNTDENNAERDTQSEETLFDIELVKQNDGPLGLTIAGNEDATQPIVLSGLVRGGLAEKTGVLKIGDHILSINGQSVHQKPLSEAINMLQNSTHRVLLKVLRKGQYGASSKITVPVTVEKTPYNNRDSTTFTNNSQSSPGLASIDSAVESWDSQPPITNAANRDITSGKDENNDSTGLFKGNNENRMSYLPTDENKLLASGYRIQDHTNESNELPLPNYSFTNTLRTFKSDKTMSPFLNENGNNNRFKLNDAFSQNYTGNNHFASNRYNNNDNNETFCDNDPHMFNKPDSSNGSFKESSPFNLSPLQLRLAYKRNHDNNSDSGSSVNNSGFPNMSDNNGQRRIYDGPRTINFQLPSAYQLPGTSNYDSDFPGLYNMDAITSQGTIHHVTLYKDVIYDDYGFSVSDGLYERGVYINRIRKGGPADIVGLLRPFDRILQVNGTRTVDFDCCLTVPLIASAGDRIELVLQRLKDSWGEETNSNTLETNNVVTKTI